MTCKYAFPALVRIHAQLPLVAIRDTFGARICNPAIQSVHLSKAITSGKRAQRALADVVKSCFEWA